MLYAKGSIVVIGSIVFTGTVNKWAQALLANSMLIEIALLAESVLKVVRKQLES